MSSNQLEMSEGTLRQRRNLITISIVLILVHHAEISFGSQLSLFGATALVGNPSFLLNGLLVSQAYFLWRFYQYFHSDKAFGYLSAQYRNQLDHDLDYEVAAQIFSKLPEGVDSFSGSKSYSKISRDVGNAGYYSVEVSSPTRNGTEEATHIVEIPKAPFKFKKVMATLGFIFRGRILTDFFLPYVLVIYAVSVHLF